MAFEPKGEDATMSLSVTRKWVIAIMVRSQERLYLGGQLPVVVLCFPIHLQRCRAISCDIDFVNGSLAGRPDR